ncbi:MAG: NAD(P)/FAD-dependent oxidoreductase [Heliobacteriaceae bacterium]|nr:NAD(P)/FAD-dependent oxidoreductase [Heliobacteriaceae bacterium]
MAAELGPVIVAGGGAGGLLAAVTAARAGATVLLLERNDRLGKKLLITGKGRCNLTNKAPDVAAIIQNFPGNGRFLYGALKRFDQHRTMDFFTTELGVPLKVERGNRVFPQSDRAGDVVAALARELQRLKVRVSFGQRVQRIRRDPAGRVTGVTTTKGAVFSGGAVIIATGGASYPGTGSTGDGYGIARELGHQVTPLRPALAPLVAAESWVGELAGLTLKNVAVTLREPTGNRLGAEFGEMLFTHFGVSGPVILTLSNLATAFWRHRETGPEHPPLLLEINLKPALTWEQVDNRLQRDFSRYQRKQLKNALGDLLPRALISGVIRSAGLPETKFVHEITREERHRLVGVLTALRLTLTGPRPLSEAIVTAGGVVVKEIDPRTMASKLVPGLFFAGEVIDVDGYTGGYNLQAAWSTGYVAGEAAAAFVRGQAGDYNGS